MSAAAVTAIVVSYDSAQVLPACLSALAAEGIGAIVVDNASGDASAEIAARYGARVLRSARNEGYGRANNLGARAAATPFILIVNPDLEIQPGAVAALLAAAEAYPDAAAFAPRLIEPSGRVFLQPRSLLSPDHLNRARRIVLPEGDACLPFLSGACLLLRREVFLALGGFDPAIFLFYEDDDLCRRLREAGHALVHVHGAEARHGRGQSSAPSPQRRFTARWHLAWSQCHVARKWGLPPPGLGKVVENLAKAIGYGLLLNRDKMHAHAGSALGALAGRAGRSALARQGLSEKPLL
ncbi:glycosyltransferase family 2 protein [Bosea sp. (in: a-proteobacteria)]|uniref:glycosyltransferase family 2 protein n=1 Tax=Bosea sp. (in: a-proteobacteria) TaxID=1871050 RepID=UPI00263884AC|nr:glycosyltransferase family 2 protein [Bosea sp. (in: a-proteobacteria)]MCO5092165.1 glycosyltransferase family 2 protein [Bosea sp. (in: a-proteobacteria)]